MTNVSGTIKQLIKERDRLTRQSQSFKASMGSSDNLPVSEHSHQQRGQECQSLNVRVGQSSRRRNADMKFAYWNCWGA
jgi:hypothetical protein